MTTQTIGVWALMLSIPVAAGCDPKAGAGPGAGSPSAGGDTTLPHGDDHELVGVQAPAFSLPAQVGGATADLAAASGKVVIVDFWATWCEPCKESFPLYQSLVDQHAGDVVVIGVSEDDEPDGIEAFAAETGASFLLAWDEDKSVARQYKPESMPTSYFIDRGGIVRLVHGGFRSGDDETITQAVTALTSQ